MSTFLDQLKDQISAPPRLSPGAVTFGKITIVDGRVRTPGGDGPVKGATAMVDSAGAIDRRVTATRLLLTGPFAFGLRKKKDSRELFIMVAGDGFSYVEEVNPKKRKQALEFAAKLTAQAA